MDVAPSPKSQAQAVGDPVEVSVNWTASGAGPDVGVAVKLAVGGAGALPSDSYDAQYCFVTSLEASITMPVAAVAVCLVPVTLFRFGDAADRMTTVPRPDGKDSALIGEVFSKIAPAVPENGQPLSGAVAYT